MADMLGKRADRTSGYGPPCSCCTPRTAALKKRGGARRAEAHEWRKDADEMSWAQEQYEIYAWYERIGYESDPWYELPHGFDGVWSTESGNVSYR